MQSYNNSIRDYARTCVKDELTRKGGTNNSYSLLLRVASENNWVNSVMDELVETTLIYSKVQSDLYGHTQDEAIRFNIGKLAMAKAAAVMGKLNPAMTDQYGQPISSQELEWIRNALTAAKLITEEVQTSGYGESSQPKPGYSSSPSGEQLPGIATRARSRIRSQAPIGSAFAQEETSSNSSLPAYEPQQRPRRKRRDVFGRTEQAAAPAPTKVAKQRRSRVILDTGMGTTTQPQQQEQTTQSRRRVNLGASTTQKPTQSTKIKESTEMPEIISKASYSEKPMDYNNHQRYTVFGDDKPNKPTTDFMGALASVDISSAKEYSARKDAGEDVTNSLVWEPAAVMAGNAEIAISRMSSRVLAATEHLPGRDFHVAFPMVSFTKVKEFDCASTRELYQAETNLGKLFNFDYVTLRDMHEALALDISDRGERSSIVSSINSRITLQINELLKFRMLSTLNIDDFVDDWEDLLGALKGMKMSQSIIDMLIGDVSPEDSHQAPGIYIPRKVASLVTEFSDAETKEIDTSMGEGMSSRAIFIKSTKVVCYLGKTFSSLPIAGIMETWSTLDATEIPYLANAYERVTSSYAGNVDELTTMVFVFPDGYEVEFKPSCRDMLPDHKGGKVYICRIINRNAV